MALHGSEGRVSGERMNRWVAAHKRVFYELKDFYKDLLMADGYPPFANPVTPLEQYQRLTAWRDAGDPRYWQSPGAQAAFTMLQRQFTVAAPVPGNF